jgi:hypothetical protein
MYFCSGKPMQFCSGVDRRIKIAGTAPSNQIELLVLVGGLND